MKKAFALNSSKLTFYSSAYLFAVLIYSEFLLAGFTTGITGNGIFLIFLFSFSFCTLLFIAELILKKRIIRLIIFILLAADAVIFIGQKIYYNIFHTFFTLYSLANGGQVFEFGGIIANEIKNAAGWILLFLLPVILFWPAASYFKGSKTVSKRLPAMLISLWFAAASFTSAVIIINAGDRLPGSPYHAYYIDLQPNYAVSNLGLFTMSRLELQHALLSMIPGTIRQNGPPLINASQNLINQTDSLDQQSSGSADSSNETEPIAPTTDPDDGATSEITEPLFRAEPVILNLDFASLAQNETNDQIRQIDQWVDQREPSLTNEYTGIYEGYNLIFITAESYSHYAVDPEITPTLYKLQHDGINFTNFYNPLWGVSTSDGEYVAVTGLIPKAGIWSLYRSGRNSMPFAMGNQLKKLGYSTFAYHNHTYDYYRRDISHPNLGYTYKGLGNGLEVAETWPESDLEMMELSLDDYIYSEPFHAYYMTVSGHLQYNYGGNFIARKNQELVIDLDLTPAAQAYMATQIELDRALEYLLLRLEEVGAAERTLIVMSADHYPYGLNHEDIESLAGKQITGLELYRSSLIVYAAGMQPQTVTEPVSSLDIIPTISNLLGLEYDSRLLMGRDIFSDTNPLVIFLDRSLT
ncbi:MAG: LTA synthase family protein, partial [Clostridiaceae bacterium]|nr:LTA synthase family protein [Clostridiaceae bacterium]